MKKFFHCEMPSPVVLLATLVQVAWLPTPEIMETGSSMSSSARTAGDAVYRAGEEVGVVRVHTADLGEEVAEGRPRPARGSFPEHWSALSRPPGRLRPPGWPDRCRWSCRRFGERAQPAGGRLRRSCVAGQGGDILSPELGVLGFEGRDRGVVCPKMLVCNSDSS